MKHFGDINQVGTLQAVTITGTAGAFGGNFSSQTISGSNDLLVQGLHVTPSVGPNLLANPTFSISIRGDTVTSANTFFPNNDDSYAMDTWNILSDGNNSCEYNRNFPNPAILATNAMAMVVVNTNRKFGAACYISTRTTYSLRGGPVSFQISAQGFGGFIGSPFKAAVLAWTGTGDVLTSDVVSSWNAQGTNPTLVSNWSYIGTPVTMTLTGSHQILKLENGYNVPTNATNLAVFFWSDDTSTAVSDQITVTNAQLEASNFCTKFQYPGDAEVRQRCQYLANSSFLDGVTPVSGDGSFNGSFKITGPVAGTQSFNASIQLPTRMRVVPTVTTYNPRSGATAVSNRNLWTNNSIDFVSTRVIQSSEQMITVDNTGVTVSGSTAAFIAGYWFATADY